MKMVSTRDESKEALHYTDVFLRGLAPDGGLYVPLAYPTVSPEELRALSGAPYEEIVFAIKRRFVEGGIPDGTLRDLIEAAYAPPLFEREEGAITPVKEIEEGFFVENLSLGPTASFKDIALQLLGREMAFELGRRGGELSILGATSGDTGSAAEAAFKGLPHITIFMLSPYEGMSDFQRAQMGALSGGNIHNISIRGRFDDCQDLVKKVMQDPSFGHFGAVNSINWGRIVSQIPYYFSGYLRTARRVGDPIDIVVPSGNFGNMLSGYIAKRMGLPLRRLIIATNENNVLDTLIKTGVYEYAPAEVTSSPSMDISKASNYERLLFDLFEGDAERVKAYMKAFSEKGRVSLSEYGLGADIFAQYGFESGSSREEDRIAAIARTYEMSGVVIDPHTADGVHVGKKAMHGDGVPMLAMSTALPVKFEATVKKALGFIPDRPLRFRNLESSMQKESFAIMDPDVALLKKFLASH